MIYITYKSGGYLPGTANAAGVPGGVAAGNIATYVDDGLADLSDGSTITTTCILSDTNQSHSCDSTSGTFNVTPGAGQYTLVKTDTTNNKVTIIGTINGSTNYTLDTQYQYVTIRKIGSSYIILENN